MNATRRLAQPARRNGPARRRGPGVSRTWPARDRPFSADPLRPYPHCHIGFRLHWIGVVMGVLHLVSWLAVVNAFITGAFIAYVYGYAHRRGHGPAILHATAFHAAINLVGWIMLVVSRGPG